MARILVLLAAICFGTTGTAQALVLAGLLALALPNRRPLPRLATAPA
ncbi:MAG TPA: hypothetical protein VKA57_15135 [Solirubrobacteraceae bacterium]|nr:hypothetical protein [Solirubrobacteraceae bacterium]